MNNRKGYNRLGRKSSHRIALHRNMVTSLFKYGRIKTTKAKAKEVRRTAEKMLTRAKVDSVHNRRIIAKDIRDKAVVAKLFTEISPQYVERNGGYTRILKLGFRNNDAAEMVLLELVGNEEEPKKNKKKSEKKSKPVKPEKETKSKSDEKAAKKTEDKKEIKKEEEPAEETPAAEEEPAEEAAAADSEPAEAADQALETSDEPAEESSEPEAQEEKKEE